MKNISNNFREGLRNDRQLTAIVSYYSSEGLNILTTEDLDNIMTESLDFLATEKGPVFIDNNKIKQVKVLSNGVLFKTSMKSVELESKVNIPVGTKLNIQIGVLVGGEYEYINYGNFTVSSEPTYQADTQTYSVSAKDKMEESMIKFDDDKLEIKYPISHKDMLIAIFEKFGWKYNLPSYANENKIIDTDLYSGQDLTYRDVLNDLCQVTGGNMFIDNTDTLVLKYVEVVEDDKYKMSGRDLKDKNVDLSKKFGPVNYLAVTTNENVALDFREDAESIQTNGKTELNINDSRLLNYNQELFIDDLFDKIKGLEYTTYDFDSTGVLCFDLFDIALLTHEDKTYNCLIINDEITLTTGLIEVMYADKPSDSTEKYSYVTPQDKKINNALISIDKANAEISLKVNKGDVVSEINLSPEVVELKGNRLVVDSANFKLDKEGNAQYSGNINTPKDIIVGNNLYVGQEHSGSTTERIVKTIQFAQSSFLSNTYYRDSNTLLMHAQTYLLTCYGNTVLNSNYNDFTRLFCKNSGLSLESTYLYIHYNDNYIQMVNNEINASSALIITSDKRLKQEIKDTDVSWIDKLKVKEFEYKNAPGKKQIGLIAQDYENEDFSKYFLSKNRKEKNSDEEYYGIAYGNITNGLIQYCQELKKSIKEQQEEIELLKSQINDIMKKIENK